MASDFLPKLKKIQWKQNISSSLTRNHGKIFVQQYNGNKIFVNVHHCSGCKIFVNVHHCNGCKIFVNVHYKWKPNLCQSFINEKKILSKLSNTIDARSLSQFNNTMATKYLSQFSSKCIKIFSTVLNKFKNTMKAKSL